MGEQTPLREAIVIHRDAQVLEDIQSLDKYIIQVRSHADAHRVSQSTRTHALASC